MSLDDIVRPEYREEADRILEMNLIPKNSTEENFINGLRDNPDKPVSRKMIFWLRDIKDRS